MFVIFLVPIIKSKIRMTKRSVINIPEHIIKESNINQGTSVWIITDGEIIVIKNIIQKPKEIPPPLIGRLRGAFRRFVSR